MSWTADIGDAIIELEQATRDYKSIIDSSQRLSKEFQQLENAIQGLMEEATGNGTHFDSVDDALRFRNVSDHTFMSGDDGTCLFAYSGTYQCGRRDWQHDTE